MQNLAVITARSGSKGLKDKNIKELCGKPLLAYTVESAVKSGVFDAVFVSTDSQLYADIAIKYGAEVPFLRSPELAGDTSDSWDAVREAVKGYEKNGNVFDMVTLLQPTSPLRDGEDIKQAFSLYKEKHAKAVISVCETEHSPLWCNTLDDSLSLEQFIAAEIDCLPRQMIPAYYRLNGAIYMVDREFLGQTKFFYQKDCYAYVMSQLRSIDIDTELDFKMAEFLLQQEAK